MSRNTVAVASPSRKVRMRPACSRTYQRPSAAWNAPVIWLNARPLITRCSRTAGTVGGVGTGLGASVGAGVGVSAGVGDGVGGSGVDAGLAAGSSDGAEDSSEVEGVADAASLVDVTAAAAHAQTDTTMRQSASRPARTSTHLVNERDRRVFQRLPRCFFRKERERSHASSL